MSTDLPLCSLDSRLHFGHYAHVSEVNAACAEIRRIAAALEALGCTDDEVAQVSSVQGLALPESYRCFLETMGRDVGGCFRSEFVSYPYLLNLRANFFHHLRAHSEDYPDVFTAPDDAAVISMIDQGYSYLFIRTSMGDDAPVENWSEGPDHDRSKIVFPSVLDWIVHAYQYATAPSREEERRELQRQLREAFVPPSCPSCGADWSGYDEVQVTADLDYSNTSWPTLILCRNCGQPFGWWWGEPPRPARNP